jgi:hypothetical protein
MRRIRLRIRLRRKGIVETGGKKRIHANKKGLEARG